MDWADISWPSKWPSINVFGIADLFKDHWFTLNLPWKNIQRPHMKKTQFFFYLPWESKTTINSMGFWKLYILV